MLLFRRIGALALALAAVAVWFLLEPEADSTGTADYSKAISSAMGEYDMNNAMADSAPQQEVVNGWVAKDLLEVIAKAQNSSLSPESAPRDDRVPAELLLLVLGVALIAATSSREGLGPQPAVAAVAPSHPAPEAPTSSSTT